VFVSNLVEHFRNLMVAKITKADPKLIDLPPEICEKLLKQSERLSLEEIFSAFNIMVNSQEMGKRLESLRVALEISLAKLACDKKGAVSSHPVPAPAKPFHGETVVKHATPHYPEQSPKGTAKNHEEEIKHAAEVKHVSVKEKIPSYGVKQHPQPLPPAPDVKIADLSITLDDIKGVWQRAADALGKIKMHVASYFSEGVPVKLDKNILTVSFPKDYSLHKESLEEKENKGLVEKILSELLNNSLKVNFVFSQDLVSKKSLNSSFIKTALETFNGRVIREE
jgi:DNA polymerase-3 subunit gamma/tau